MNKYIVIKLFVEFIRYIFVNNIQNCILISHTCIHKTVLLNNYEILSIFYSEQGQSYHT